MVFEFTDASTIISYGRLSVTIGCIIIVLCIVYAVKTIRHIVSLPPGPWGYPVVGVLPLLGDNPNRYFQQMSKKFGHVCSMMIGSRLVVIVSGTTALKEFLLKNGDNFAARPDTVVQAVAESHGIIWTEGDMWKEQRRFSLTALRNFGMGKLRAEEVTHHELQILTSGLEQLDGQSVDLKKYILASVGNVVGTILFGRRFENTEPIYAMLNDTADVQVEMFFNETMFTYFPALRDSLFTRSFLRSHKKRLDDMFERENAMRTIMKSFINESLTQLDVDNPKGFLDAYLIKRRALEDEGNQTPFSNDDQLAQLMVELFDAGHDTTAMTIMTGILYLARNTDVQRNMQIEIDDIVGGSRMPSSADRTRLVYTDAAIMEIQRLSCLFLPNTLPYRSIRSVNICGFEIPKDAWVYPNWFATMRGSEHWENSLSFEPKRFIDQDGKIRQLDAFLPFGLGRRECLGKTLAKVELFLFFTSLLQQFTFTAPPGEDLPSPESSICSNLMRPPLFNVLITKRH
ncbi:unnamed protein product [Owenia fusiformis]|uniref:Uncharacterized protein n=1 Tax=Owenia fusiformis TaxID=6347 RepID=A0A8J1XU51_OWEFU|nr:unnamed protein product [Owenia fusiformis]